LGIRLKKILTGRGMSFWGQRKVAFVERGPLWEGRGVGVFSWVFKNA